MHHDACGTGEKIVQLFASVVVLRGRGKIMETKSNVSSALPCKDWSIRSAMFIKKLLIAASVMMTVSLLPAQADMRVDIKNDSSEDCSVAFNARTDKTKWVTAGWYVFVAGEEAPVILKGTNDIHDVFIFHDCGLKPSEDDEVKRGWVKTNLKFTDDMPKENEEGYQEVLFVRLHRTSYIIGGEN